MKLQFIDDAWRHFHRSWAVRASLAFGVFTGVLMGLPAFIDTLNPLLFMGLAVLFNVLIIPLSRVVKQEPLPVVIVPAPAPGAAS